MAEAVFGFGLFLGFLSFVVSFSDQGITIRALASVCVGVGALVGSFSRQQRAAACLIIILFLLLMLPTLYFGRLRA
jgi:hypothetical protein